MNTRCPTGSNYDQVRSKIFAEMNIPAQHAASVTINVDTSSNFSMCHPGAPLGVGRWNAIARFPPPRIEPRIQIAFDELSEAQATDGSDLLERRAGPTKHWDDFTKANGGV
jgi:hypothetical protein